MKLVFFKYAINNIVMLTIVLISAFANTYVADILMSVLILCTLVYKYIKKIPGPPYFLVSKLRDLPEYNRYSQNERDINARNITYIFMFIFLFLLFLYSTTQNPDKEAANCIHIVVIIGIANILMILNDI